MNIEVQEIQVDKYPAYKVSGVEWLGEIPEHWKIISFRYLIDILTDYTANGSFGDLAKNVNYLDFKDYSRLIRLTDLRKNLKNSGVFLNEKSHKYLHKSELYGGELLIANVGAYAGLAWIMPFIDEKASLGPNMFLIKLLKGNSISFFELLINSSSYKSYIQEIAKSSAQPKLNKDNIRQLRIVLPPHIEQQSIANFLNDKCSNIDAAIEIKQKQIALLKERRQIAIHQAVTRGLDKNVLLKDSGVEWIGKIPEHWEVKKIKNVTSKVGSGITPSGGGTIYVESGIPLLRSQNIFFDRIELDGVAYISEKIYQSMSNSQVFKGDVLLNITGGSIGRCCFVDFDIRLNVNQHVCILRPNRKITTHYLNSLIASEVGQNQIWFHQQGGGREGLNFQALKNFNVPYPPLQEQKEISEYIEAVTTKIDTAISLKQQEIEKLKEYKTSLINSAVTGKIKVSEVN